MTGRKMQRGFRLALCAAAIGACMSSAMAAQVPPGTALAAKQEIVRHIKDEPASLDPIKAVGLPEASWRAICSKGWSIRTPAGK